MKKKVKKREIKEKLIFEGGDQPYQADEKAKELEILNYPKTSIKLWKQDPRKNSELPMMSLFMQLNYGESDLMASFEELDKLFTYIQPSKDQEGNTISPLERAKLAFDQYEEGGFIDFRQFQQFMKDVGLEEQADEIDKFYYRYYFTRNCCTMILRKCFAKPFRGLRMKQVANRMKKIMELENEMKPTKPVDILQIIQACVTVFGGYAQLFDFYTDIFVLYAVYIESIKYQNSVQENDYMIALTVLFTSLTATFLTQQSCIIGMKFAQGDFEPHNFKALGCFGRFVNIMILTFIGVFFTAPIEILDNLTKMFTLPGLLFGGATGVSKVQEFFTFIKQKLTRLNGYQLNCLEQQRKTTALLFENVPFTLLIFIVKIGYMDVEALRSPTADISLYSSLLQVGVTILTTFIESRWLKESTLTYLMTKTTANNNWIPFIHKITKRECEFNINYGDLAIDIPFVTHAMGFQMVTRYEFSDNTLNYLLNELMLWSSEIRGQPQKSKQRLIFTKDCLNQVSFNTFIHFVQNFPQDVFILEIQLDWQKFYDQKEKEGQIEYTIEDGEKRTYSPTGVPLLQLCIQNETTSAKWPLKQALHIILKSGHYNLYNSKHGSPLIVALQDNCFESIHIINSGDYNFDIQTQDAEGKSFIGHLIKKMLEDPDQQGLEFDKLVGFSQSIFREIKLDLHKEQFANIGTVKKQISAWQLIFKSLRHHRSVRLANKTLIDFVKKQGNYELNASENNTLFKSSLKGIMSYGRDSASAMRIMAQFCGNCQVNIFEQKDSLGKGLEHRFIRLWPIQFESARYLQQVLNPFLTNEMAQQRINPSTHVFQKVVSEGLVPDILKKSIFTAKNVLKIDYESGEQIKSFNQEEKQLLLALMAKAQITNYNCYADLVPIVQRKIEDFKGEFTQQIQSQVKEQLQGEKSQAKQDEQSKDQDDIAEFEGQKLTRRKVGNGNLKRNVSNELQKDPALNRLSPQQIDNLGIVEYSPEVARRKILGNILRTTLETILEWIAAADLYTDALVFFQLLQTNHHAWTTITIFSLLAPFFACQTPFLMFLKEQVYRDKNDRFKLQFMGYIMVQPLMLVYLFCLDIIFIVNQALLFPLIQILKFITCGIVDLSILNRGLDKSYEYFFEMKKLEVAGFRRMRTISQLTFESLIQVTLQIRMLIYFNSQKSDKGMDEFGVSVTAILISIILATIHALLECVFLYMEAQASKTSFTNYCIVCFNGRFGWVPYNDYLMMTSQQMQDDQQTESTNKKLSARVELDFQNIQSKLCCFDLQVEFVFSNDTILSLTKTLASFPPLEHEKDMPQIKFGHTVDNVSLENLESLLRVCKGKVLIDLKGTDLQKIYMNSRHANLLKVSNVSDLSEQDNNYLFNLHKSKLTQLLFFILKNNDQNLKAQIYDEKEKQMVNFAKIAYIKRDSELLELLLCLNSDVFKAQMSEVENRNSLTVRLLNTIDFDIWLTIASNSDTFNPHQESLIFQAFMNMQTADPALFRKSMKWWHGRFGPCMPQEVINDVMRYSPAHDFMKEYKKMYPQKVYIRSDKHYIEVETKTAFCFPLIRKKLVKAWDIDASGPSIDHQSSEGTLNKPLDIGDLEIPLSDFKLLNMILSDKEHGSIKNLTREKVQQLDDICYKLKMDTYRWLYVGRTRLGDDTGSQIDVIFYGKDVHCPEDDKPSARHEIEAGFSRKFDDPNDDDHTYQNSLEVNMPENMSFMTFHKSYHKKPARNSAMSTFIFNKDTVLRGYLFCYSEQRQLVEQSDVTIIAQPDEQGRVEAIKSAKPIYQIDTVKPGAKVQYCPQSLWSYTTMQNLRITMRIDFPMHADLDKEQKALEQQAQVKKQEHAKSLEPFNNELEQNMRMYQ